MFRTTLLAGVAMAALALPLKAFSAQNNVAAQIEELDPFDPNVEQYLEDYDQAYQAEFGESPWLPNFQVWGPSCYRASCPVWVQVNKSTQTLNLYLDGQLANSWKVSTGIAGRDTPRFDKNPDGRVYTKYTSGKFPGGDYKGLGNMPYAIFIRGGFALHGTPSGNWSKLGRRASHGCIRQHPDNARYLNQLVRQNGVNNVWITVQ
jgi:L,D-transpeptidase catalytic domain